MIAYNMSVCVMLNPEDARGSSLQNLLPTPCLFPHLQNGVSGQLAGVFFPKGGKLRQGAGWGCQSSMQVQAGGHIQGVFNTPSRP